MNEQVETPVVEWNDFIKVDLRVARILTVEEIPGADKLYKMTVDDGTIDPVDGPRQICAGIKQHYAAQDLIGKFIVIVANLKPRLMRGEISEGMLLAATDVNGKVILIQPATDVLPGSQVG